MSQNDEHHKKWHVRDYRSDQRDPMHGGIEQGSLDTALSRIAQIGLVGYDRALISGAFIGVAPLEDFAYAVAAAILLPSLWALLGGRKDA